MKPYLSKLSERVRRGEYIAPPLAILLHAATPLTWLGMRIRMKRPRISVKARVISIGNLTAGGTGKTPAVIEQVCNLLSAGNRVAVLTRGYGGKNSGELTAVDTSLQVRRPWLGDEPELIMKRAPGVVLVRGRNRIQGAQLAINQYGCSILILDDGFQYVRLQRDEDIVVIDAMNPFGNGYLLPRGLLREPVESLERATSLLVTRCDLAPDLPVLVDKLRHLCPGKPIRLTRHAPIGLWRVSDGSPLPLDALRNNAVAAVCAIGHPEAFFATLESLGAEVKTRLIYRDHTEIPIRDIPMQPLVITTEKDAVRFDGSQVTKNLYALAINLEDMRMPC